MMRLIRIGSCFALACLLALPASLSPAWGDDTDNAAAPAAPAPDNSGAAAPMIPAAVPPDNSGTAALPGTTEAQPSLVDLVDTYWHYGKIARYDLAVYAGKRILSSGADDAAILSAFENVAARHGDAIDVWMLRWRSLPTSDALDRADVEAMRAVSTKLNDVINQGYATRRNDPDYIRKTLIEMSTSQRAYDNNMPRLAQSGEVAVKIIVDFLRDPSQAQYYDTCRRALVDLGRKALNPLLAATEMKDYSTLVDVISALGSLGYDSSIPYLARLAQDPSVPESIHNASRNAMFHLGLDRNIQLNTSALFYNLAVKCYYGRSDIPPAGDKTSFIWYWDANLGLTRKMVPTPIFNDLLAMRNAEYAMKLDASNGPAVSLWLDANTKREVDLPAGEVDVTHKGDPDANYYNVSAGAEYLDAALARATQDRSAAVALRLCQSLRNIIGQANLRGDAITPLMQALYFPNRQVRYAAAFALAQSLPGKAFAGSDRVVPLLVEAVNQTNKPGVVVVAPATGSADSVTEADLRDAVQSLGYPVVAASNPHDAADAAITLPTVDLIIISEDSDVRQMIDLEQNIARLQGASMLVLTHTIDNPYAVASATNLLMNAAAMPAKGSLKDELKIDIDQARQHSGTAVMSEEDAARYSLDAAGLLEKLAITRDHALNVSVAEAGLLTALGDSRAPIAEAAGKVLGTLRSVSAQNGLAMKANSDATPAEVRVSLYQSLADSAKRIGNHLDSEEIDALEKVVSTSTQSNVRDAAAEARGALNLPASQARTLILNQSRV